MELNNKIEHLKYAIDRYDLYFDSVNTKGNVYLTIMTFLLGGTLTIFHSESDKFQTGSILWSLLVLIILIQVTGIFVTLSAIKPFLKSGTKPNDRSAIYFGDVATFSIDEYRINYDNRDLSIAYNDYIKQVHQLAIGLKKKYQLLWWSTIIIGAQLFSLTIIGVLIINK